MNNDRRKRIQAIMDDLTAIMDRIEEIKDEEQQYADDMPDNLQDSQKHETAEETASLIGDAYDQAQEAHSTLESAKDNGK